MTLVLSYYILYFVPKYGVRMMYITVSAIRFYIAYPNENQI